MRYRRINLLSSRGMASRASKNLTVAELAGLLASEPLIGVTASARRLGIKAPNFKRDAVPHLTPVPVEGSADVYFRSEVDALAARFAQARAKRENGDTPAARDVHQPGSDVKRVRSSAQARGHVEPIPKTAA